MKIGLRILLGYFVIVALAALLLGRVFLQEVKPGVRQAMEDTLVDSANILAELARDDLLTGHIDDGTFAQHVRALTDRDLGADIWGFSKRKVTTRIYVTDVRGIVVFDSDGRDLGKDYSRWNDVYRTLRGQYGARSTRSDPNDEASTVMHVAAPIVIRGEGAQKSGSKIIGVLTLAKPNQTIAPFILRSQQVILHWGFVLLGTALVVGLMASWWLSRQIGALRRYANAVTAGERATPPDAAGEFGELGRSLETMREKLEGKQYVEQYVHALTHELKSPLAAIRGSAELLESSERHAAEIHAGELHIGELHANADPHAYINDNATAAAPMPAADRARFVATIRAQSERMAEMIDKLLALAAVEHRQRIEQPQRLDMSVIAKQAATQLAAKFEQRDMRLTIINHTESEHAPPDQSRLLMVDGDAFLLRQSLVNLLDNAADFAPKGSEIELCVGRDQQGVRIEVLDRGTGVPDYAIDRVFERFYSLPRPGGSSRSSGLGLCFVAEAAALHNGRIVLSHREGGGTVAAIVLPDAA